MDIWDLKHHFELALRAAAPSADPQAAGTVATWGPLEADAPRWAAPLFGLEVRIEIGPAPVAAYQPLPTQPPAVRDLSLVLPLGTAAAAVEAVLRREGGALLERLEVLDEYRGASLPAGTRGVTWRCTFRDPARTLTEREIDALLSRMLKALEAQLGVHRRQS